MNNKNTETKVNIQNSTSEFLIFTQQEGGKGIEARYEEGTIWLTQKLMGELFDVTPLLLISTFKIYSNLRKLIKIQLLRNS